MKTKHGLIIPAIYTVILMFAAGCKKTAPPPPSLHQYYQVNYLLTENRCWAKANFTVAQQGGPAAIFTDKSIVTANGMTDNIGVTTSLREFIWNINDMTDVTFEFKKKDGTITNKVQRSSIGDIELVMDSVLPVTDTMRAAWKGTTLQEGESVHISMNRMDSQNEPMAEGIYVDFTGKECTLDFGKTRSFTPGTYRVLIVKEKILPLQEVDGTGSGELAVTLNAIKMVSVK